MKTLVHAQRVDSNVQEVEIHVQARPYDNPFGIQKKEEWQDVGGGIVSMSRASYQSFTSKCDNVWPALLNEVLNNYIEDMRDDVVGSQQQASCNALSNVNESKIVSLSPTPSMAREVVSEHIPKP